MSILTEGELHEEIEIIPVMWLCCTLLFLPFLVAGPSNAQCTMTSGQLDAELASCGAGDLDCFVSKAKSNVSCAANIAWYYMIVYAPEDPTVVVHLQFNPHHDR